MARVSIYVPDEMRADMDALGDRVNWSAVAQEAFAARLGRAKQMESRMVDVIERLRESKLKDERYARERGRLVGRKYAERVATYRELEALAAFRPALSNGFTYTPLILQVYGCIDLANGVTDADHPNSDSARNWLDDHITDGEPAPVLLSDEHLSGWLDGVREVWDEVKDKI